MLTKKPTNMFEVLKTWGLALSEKICMLKFTLTLRVRHKKLGREGQETMWPFTRLTKLHPASNFDDYQSKLIKETKNQTKKKMCPSLQSRD